MLGLPDLLILDEPTNGLDPPQIREMREVMIRYAEAGRTVIVSSHLLAEVEQSCTHLVVMDRGRLVQAGPVAEIIGSGDTLLVGLAGDISDSLVEKIAALTDVESVVRAEGGLLVRLAPGDEPAPDDAPAPGDELVSANSPTNGASTAAATAAAVTPGGAVTPAGTATEGTTSPPPTQGPQGPGTAARLLVELVRLEVPVSAVGPHRRLEDAFLTLIGGSA
jgi:ABC-2 type transport system ATP-binding protein